MDPDSRLLELGLVLPPPVAPVGQYDPAVLVDDMLYLSGVGPMDADGRWVTGKVGASGLDLAAARAAARLAGLQILSNVRTELGELARVRQVVKVFGMVNCAPGFTDTPAVIDGCSELFVEVFGPAGRSARSAVGMAELPFGIPVEIEAVVRIHPW
jgi:enamine deaminase RidA (YjgF/YER057c/UK114 family)